MVFPPYYFLCKLKFFGSKVATSLYYHKQGNIMVYCLIYVNYLILTGNDSNFVAYVIKWLQ